MSGILELKVDTAKKVDKATLLPREDGFSYHFTIRAGGKVFYCGSSFGNRVAMERSLEKVKTDLESGTVQVFPVDIPIEE